MFFKSVECGGVVRYAAPLLSFHAEMGVVIRRHFSVPHEQFLISLEKHCRYDGKRASAGSYWLCLVEVETVQWKFVQLCPAEFLDYVVSTGIIDYPASVHRRLPFLFRQ